MYVEIIMNGCACTLLLHTYKMDPRGYVISVPIGTKY